MKFSYSVLVYFFISMLCFSYSVSSQFLTSTPNEGDFQALLSIKAQIVQDPFRILASWNNSVHFCNWTGVSCNITQERVLGLDLSGFELSGTLSDSIGNLTFLKNLNLENNLFSGTIPQTVCQLYSLEQLVLSNNSFQGEIPRNLSYLSKINVFDLNRNNLSGTIPPSLGYLSALRVLSLSDNNLEGVIPQEFGMLSSLQILQLSSNELVGTIPHFLYNITALQQISLASNSFSGYLPFQMNSYFPNLQTFSVGGNQFVGSIPSSISNSSGLLVFDIGGNYLSGPIPMDFGNLKQLQRLDLSANSLGSNDSNGLKFLTSLINCTNLRTLHLNDNNHSGILPASIVNLSTTLESLRLDGNYISGEIPAGLERLVNLGRLSLSRNSLVGTIPDSIGKLTKLQGLYLSNNRFVGGIPSSIGNITRLSILEMQENSLEGDIPASLSNFLSLIELDLSNNRLSNSIPPELFHISTLTIDLNLAHNLLSGVLPSEVGNLKNLLNLDISHNNLSGELPSAIDGCVSLQLFSVQSNHFSSSIPSFMQLRSIQFLDLSNNNFIGEIPRGFTTLRFLQFLNLSFNALEGEVPNEGFFMNTTAFSVEGNGKLCGGVKSLKLAGCFRKFIFTNKQKILVLPSVGYFIILLVEYSCVFYYWQRSEGTENIKKPLSSPLGDHYPKLSYVELLQATDSFSPTTLVAAGRYSTVYKGILTKCQQTIAVKVINLQQSGARKSFLVECEALRNIRHKNLVKIITSCSGTDIDGHEFKALVYEFMSNGDLDSWLHPTTDDLQQPKNLDFLQRLNIAIDVASALFYLHHCCEMPVIHRDIKPSNILLDDELCARVGDFGSARSLLLPIDKNTHLRIRSSAIGIVGTAGYVALECGMGGRVSTLVDVYSYGILLLEMFTSRRPTDSMFKDNFSLRNYVKMAIPGCVMSIADPRLLADWQNLSHSTTWEIEKCLASVFNIGVTCSSHSAKERMKIADALMVLRVIRDAYSKLVRENITFRHW